MMQQVFQVSERIVLEQKAYMLFYVRDRRNIIPRKPVEVARKENFSSAGFKNRSTSNQGSKELVQNVSVEGRSSGLASSVVAIQKDESNIVPPMVPLLKGASVKSQITAEKMVPMKESVSESIPKVSLSKDPPKELSLPNPKLGKDMLQSSSFPSRYGGASDPENATAATTDANKNDLNKRGSSIENSGVSTVIATNVKDPESLEAAKPVPDEASQDVSGCYISSVHFSVSSFTSLRFYFCFVLGVSKLVFASRIILFSLRGIRVRVHLGFVVVRKWGEFRLPNLQINQARKSVRYSFVLFEYPCLYTGLCCHDLTPFLF